MNQLYGNRYEYKKTIGHGGTGSVFLVYDTKLQMHWAMKVTDTKEKRELEALCQVVHPAFPRIVDSFSIEEKTGLIMDYIQGIPLSKYVSSHFMSQSQICDVGIQLAKAFSYLHRQNPPIYYLDCKPDNVILTNEGQVKIVDLGSAYFDIISTRMQRISGTPFYASKEQKEGNGEKSFLSPQCDIYSLGMTLFFLLTGKEQELRDKKGRLFAKECNPKVSDGLNYIVEKCTRIQRKQRYQTMDEVIRDLERMETLTGKEKIKRYFMNTVILLEKIVLAIGILKLAEIGCQKENILYFTGAMILFAFLLIRCRGKKHSYFEVEKEVFKGCGSRTLYLLFLLFVLPGNLQVNAGGKEEALPVLIQDKENRNILIKEGTVWEPKEDIRLKIPLCELENGEQTITVTSYQDKSKMLRTYQFTLKKEETRH